MRYAVYITRAAHWPFEDREREPIAETEWLAYAEGDRELRPLHSVPCFDCDTGELVGQVRVEKTWEWTAHPHGAKVVTRGRPTFEYNRGGVIVRAPDAALLHKTLLVAAALKANVIGDDDVIVRA
jgi:hypothetical protein